MVVALRPQQGAFLSWGALAVLGSAMCYALSALPGRVLTRTDASASLVFWTTALLALGGGALAWPQWVAVHSGHWPLVAGLAVSGFCGQLAITEAFRKNLGPWANRLRSGETPAPTAPLPSLAFPR